MSELITRREILASTAAVASTLGLHGQASAQDRELSAMTAAQIVSAVRERKVKAAEVARAALNRTMQLKEYNLFTAIDQEKTMAAAETIDRRLAAGQEVGPVAGLPFVAKDNIDTSDLPTTNGSSAFAGWQPKADAPIVAALRDAGAVLVGKTNMHEFAYGTTSNNKRYGPVRNPYNRLMIPGGSSGGTGAAIGGRVVAAGLGTDTGGSVRIPAALCGCVGFRPTSGRYSLTGIIPLSWSQDTAGPMGRTVEDVILLDAVCSNDRPHVSEVPLAGARIAVPRARFYDGLDPEVATVAESTLTVLRKEGAVLVDVNIPNLPFGAALGFEMLRGLAAYLYLHGSRLSVIDLVAKMDGQFEKGVLEMQLGSKATEAAAYLEATTVGRPAVREGWSRFFKDNNLLAMVVPTTFLPARPIRDDDTVDLGGKRVPAFQTYTRNAGIGSAGHLPCLTFPAGVTSDGLPVGMELVGPAMGDATVLALGRALQKALPAIPAPPV